MILSGVNEEKGLVEIVEIPNHPWFIELCTSLTFWTMA